MKKKALILAMAVAAGLSAQSAMAAGSGAGCGLGKMIMEGKSGKGANIAASILNVVIIPNTLFMSTAATMGEEVLGCDPTKTVMKEEQQKSFIAANMDDLSRDIAQGQGMHLDALASLMGVEEQDKSLFVSMTREEFGSLFPVEQASAEQVLSSLQVAMLSRPELGKYVQ